MVRVVPHSSPLIDLRQFMIRESKPGQHCHNCSGPRVGSPFGNLDQVDSLDSNVFLPQGT